MNVRESFGQQLAAEWADGGDDVELLPAQLARAAVRTLGVAGVGLSLHEVLGRSTPLGASDALSTSFSYKWLGFTGWVWLRGKFPKMVLTL